MPIHPDIQRLVGVPSQGHRQLQSKKRGAARSSLLTKLGQMLPMMVFVMAIFYAPGASAQNGATEVDALAIWEHVLYEDLKQASGTHAFYKMTVG